MKSDDSQTNDINEYDFTNLKDYVDSKVPNEINFKIPFMKDAELTNALESLNTKTSTCLDGLSPKILNISARIIGPSLLKMINYSINSGIFPDNLKIARLIPIHKGGRKDDPSNFRPISILTFSYIKAIPDKIRNATRITDQLSGTPQAMGQFRLYRCKGMPGTGALHIVCNQASKMCARKMAINQVGVNCKITEN